MGIRRVIFFWIAIVGMVLGTAPLAHAHGMAGKRLAALRERRGNQWPRRE